MNKNNWRHEHDRLLEIFECESKFSLRKIRQYFQASGCSFDENFRKYFQRLATLTLKTLTNDNFTLVLYQKPNKALYLFTFVTNDLDWKRYTRTIYLSSYLFYSFLHSVDFDFDFIFIQYECIDCVRSFGIEFDISN